jgi:hypothetical protein
MDRMDRMGERVSGYTAAVVQRELEPVSDLEAASAETVVFDVDGPRALRGKRHGIAPDSAATLCGLPESEVMRLRSYLAVDDPRSCPDCVSEARRLGRA